MARNTKAPAASKAPAATQAPQGIVEKGAPCTVPNGYVLYQQANPCKPGSMRHDRWPLLVKFAGVPDGQKALAAAIEEKGLKTNLKGAMRYLRIAKMGAAS